MYKSQVYSHEKAIKILWDIAKKNDDYIHIWLYDTNGRLVASIHPVLYSSVKAFRDFDIVDNCVLSPCSIGTRYAYDVRIEL